MAGSVLLVLLAVVLTSADARSSLSDTSDSWRSRVSSLDSALESLHLRKDASGKAQWMELRSQLGPPLAYANGTALCNGKPVDPAHVECVGNYEVTTEYSKVTKRGAVFEKSKLTCGGEWKVDTEEDAASGRVTISASCKGIFRDTATIIVACDAGTKSTLSDYHCAFGFTYNAEIETGGEELKYSENMLCKLSEFYRVLTNEEGPSAGSENLKDSLEELSQQLGMVFVPKDMLDEVPQEGTALDQRADDDNSIKGCDQIVTCNGLPASEYQPCRGVFDQRITCDNLIIEQLCKGDWAPFLKAATCKGTWSISFSSFTTSSIFAETAYCNGDAALATEHIKIMGHVFDGNAESCFGTAGISSEASGPAPGPAPGPGAQWQADPVENGVLQTLDVIQEQYGGFSIS